METRRRVLVKGAQRDADAMVMTRMEKKLHFRRNPRFDPESPWYSKVSAEKKGFTLLFWFTDMIWMFVCFFFIRMYSLFVDVQFVLVFGGCVCVFFVLCSHFLFFYWCTRSVKDANFFLVWICAWGISCCVHFWCTCVCVFFFKIFFSFLFLNFTRNFYIILCLLYFIFINVCIQCLCLWLCLWLCIFLTVYLLVCWPISLLLCSFFCKIYFV